MTYKVQILPTAGEDLKKIEDWYVVQFGVQTALEVVDHILTVIERLEMYPESGSLTRTDRRSPAHRPKTAAPSPSCQDPCCGRAPRLQ